MPARALVLAACLSAAASAAPSDRLSAEWQAFLTAISNPYELNGKAVTRTVDLKAIITACNSKDPALRDAGRRAAVVYGLQASARRQSLDLEVAAILLTHGLAHT